MFKKPTVFILGAGASKDVGMPIGTELMPKIANVIDIEIEYPNRVVGGDRRIVDAHVNGNVEHEINRLIGAGKTIKQGLKYSASIDNYLKTHLTNADIVKMGKMGIALAISIAELNCNLSYDFDNKRFKDSVQVGKSWINKFCQMAWEGIEKHEIDGLFKNVTIVTFNYDRIFEFFVYMAVKDYFDLTDEEAQGVLRQLKVIHVYGHIGSLTTNVSNFSKPISAGQLVSTANGIKTFSENIDDDATLDKIHAAISECEKLIFVGFGFLDINMQLLACECKIKKSGVFATTFGIAPENKKVIFEILYECFGYSFLSQPVFADQTAADFMRDHDKPIMR